MQCTSTWAASAVPSLSTTPSGDSRDTSPGAAAKEGNAEWGQGVCCSRLLRRGQQATAGTDSRDTSPGAAATEWQDLKTEVFQGVCCRAAGDGRDRQTGLGSGGGASGGRQGRVKAGMVRGQRRGIGRAAGGRVSHVAVAVAPACTGGRSR